MINWIFKSGLEKKSLRIKFDDPPQGETYIPI